MIVSNDPGYYKEGAYGIRIENVVLVTEPAKIGDGDREMMGFETLTLAPIDRRLIEPDALSQSERDWLNAYHARVYDILAPSLAPADQAWLRQATQKL
jgi:Xaa-Pro aminopeptidase